MSQVSGKTISRSSHIWRFVSDFNGRNTILYIPIWFMIRWLNFIVFFSVLKSGLKDSTIGSGTVSPTTPWAQRAGRRFALTVKRLPALLLDHTATTSPELINNNIIVVLFGLSFMITNGRFVALYNQRLSQSKHEMQTASDEFCYALSFMIANCRFVALHNQRLSQ